MEEEPNQVNSYFLVKFLVSGAFIYIITLYMMSRNKWGLSAEGKVKQTKTLPLHNRAVYFCWTSIGGMENSHMIVVATLTQASYPYPEVNEHENISDAVVNTILCALPFRLSLGFYIVQHNENTSIAVCVGCPVRKHSWHLSQTPHEGKQAPKV